MDRTIRTEKDRGAFVFWCLTKGITEEQRRTFAKAKEAHFGENHEVGLLLENKEAGEADGNCGI
jgi:hypothetical protein